MFQTNCFDIWREEEAAAKLITLCKDLDDHLGGGIPMRMITELCGAPGSGKTQMCLQLSINVQFPKEVGGLGGKAIFLDTNQDFHPARLKEIAEHMQHSFQKTLKKALPSAVATEKAFSSDTLLHNVSYIYCANYVQLTAAVLNLRQLLNSDIAIKLVIIDSFSFPLRAITDVTDRLRISYEILTNLQQLALEFQIAVVITNELTTRITGNNSKICPALGDSHTHKINQRIILCKKSDEDYHVALLDKSAMKPKVEALFQIKRSGIRGVIT